MTADLVMAQRGTIRKGVVQAVDDTGAAQMAEVVMDDTGDRALVEIMQPFGHAGVPPIDGAIVLVLAVGADPGHLVGLPVSNPSWRFGAARPGESVVYDAAGQRLHFRGGALVELHAGALLTISSPAVTIQGPGGADAAVGITGSLVVSGDVSDQAGVHGTLNLLRGDHNAHTHSNSAGVTTPPNLVTG